MLPFGPDPPNPRSDGGDLNFLSGGGEMGARMRAHDWADTPLGPPSGWPQSLRSVLSVCLASPMLGTVLWGEELLFLYNDAYIASLADRHPDALGRPVAEVWGDTWAQVAAPFHRAMQTGESFARTQVELQMVRDGKAETTWWNFTAAPIRGEDGSIVGLLNQGVEITEQVRNGEALRRSQDRLSAAIAVARLGTFEWDLATDAVLLDPRARELYGFDADEAIDVSRMFARIDPLDVERVQADVAEARRAGTRLYTEYRVRLPDGTWRDIVSISNLVTGADGLAVRVIGVFEDLTDRRAAADRLLASEGRYRQIVEGAEDFAIVTLDDAGVISGWNTGAEHITGFPAAEAIGRPVGIFFTPEDRAARAPEIEMERSRRDGRASDERWHQRRDGSRFWGSGLMMRLDVPGGGFLKMFRDRTAEHESEAQVRRSEERLRELNHTLERRVADALAERQLLVDIVDTTATCIQAIDADYRFLAINKAGVDEYERIYGVRPRIGDSLLDLLADRPALQARARAVWAPALAGDTYKCAEEFGDPAHARRYYDLTFEPLRDALGEPLGAFMTGFDISDRMRDRAALEAAQDALRQSQKMEAVGKLTGGIAHDFNNMLAVVIGSLDLLGRRIGADDTRARRHVDAATDGARRAALLTQRLLAFARQQPLRPAAMDVNRLVEGMADLIRGSLGTDIRFETVLADGAWRTNADPNQLENVLLNLAVNARDAMPDGGRLTVETRHVRLDAQEAAACGGIAPGDHVLLSVTDTGTGMSAEVRDRAFDPFFTTKEVGKGTGLGLSQVYGFVAQSGGHVGIESTPGHGTTVKVWLPRLTGASAEEVATVPASPSSTRGAAGETILVVEDEPAVRQLSVDALGELGYRVLQADGAAAALRLLGAHPEIALLFTDIVMPDVNGRRLADLARQQRPVLKVLFTTGYTSDAVIHGGALGVGVELIGKPFSVEGLSAKVRGLLDAA